MSDSRLLRAMLRLIDGASTVFAAVAGVALALLVGTVAIDVIGRALFGHPYTGTLEMTANWWMPMITLLAMGLTEKTQEHIKVTLLLDALPPRFRVQVEAVFAVLATLLLLMLAWYTLQEALQGAAIGRTTAGHPPIAIWPFVFVAVAGLVMLALQTAATAIRRFCGQAPQA